jgi:putative (di)nucleoside polyphosphate hydrolase
MAEHDDNLYRRGVGVMLLNRDGKVFVGARIDNADDAWQMPQGGIDEGEDPWATALRELEEETGIPPRLVERIADCPERLKYRLPDELIGVLWKEPWVGQDQDWFLARFLGTDADVNIAAAEHPEFREWRWVAPADLPELIVPFKRDLYRRLLREFAAYF